MRTFLGITLLAASALLFGGCSTVEKRLERDCSGRYPGWVDRDIRDIVELGFYGKGLNEEAYGRVGRYAFRKFRKFSLGLLEEVPVLKEVRDAVKKGCKIDRKGKGDFWPDRAKLSLDFTDVEVKLEKKLGSFEGFPGDVGFVIRGNYGFFEPGGEKAFVGIETNGKREGGAVGYFRSEGEDMFGVMYRFDLIVR